MMGVNEGSNDVVPDTIVSSSDAVVSADVIARVAAKAVLGVSGVISVDNTFTDGIYAALTRDKRTHGVRITQDGDGCAVHLGVVTRYGERIPEIAWNIQNCVKNTLEDFLGVRVTNVNVLIAGIREL